MSWLQWTASAALLPALGGCSPELPSYRSEFPALGTTLSVAIAATDPEQAAATAAAVEALAQKLGKDWYAWTPDGDGELARLNAALARGEPRPVSAPLWSLLQRTQELFAASEGYFDPAIGKLVALWGFDRAERPGYMPLPRNEDIAKWTANRPSFADVELADGAVGAKSMDVCLDLGAIGKGRVVDLAMELLQQRGVRKAMVDAGGNLRAINLAANRAWRIAIRNPRGPEPLAWLELQADESASTSGDYERHAMVGGQHVHHLFDPYSGKPVAHTIAVTVLAQDATTADAASTALMAAGPAHWRRIARRMNLRYVLRIDAHGDMEVSSALRSRLHFSASVATQHKITTVEL